MKETLTTFYPLTNEDFEAFERGRNTEHVKVTETVKLEEGSNMPENSKANQNQYETSLQKIIACSDKMISSYEPYIIQGCVKEIEQMSEALSLAGAKLREVCRAFYLGDAMRVDIRREIIDLFEDYKKAQILDEMSVMAEKHNMTVEEMLELVTSTEDD